MLRKKCNEYEQQIKSLMRDNKVLAKKIDKIEGASSKKSKKIDNEKDMRLRANRDRYALKQKLDRLQKALEARLKMLGIDFSNINDLSEALEAAFAAIQKLAAEVTRNRIFSLLSIYSNEVIGSFSVHRNSPKTDFQCFETDSFSLIFVYRLFFD